MSILIKGMEMPITCDDCFLPLQYCPYAMKPNGECPLVPIPTPHGRLIAEADAVETAWMILRGLGYLKEENHKLEQTVREVFATAPAIEVE